MKSEKLLNNTSVPTNPQQTLRASADPQQTVAAILCQHGSIFLESRASAMLEQSALRLNGLMRLLEAVHSIITISKI